MDHDVQLAQALTHASSSEEILSAIETFGDHGIFTPLAGASLEGLLNSSDPEVRTWALFTLVTMGKAYSGYEAHLLITIILLLVDESDTIFTAESLLKKMRAGGSESARWMISVLEGNRFWRERIGQD